MINDYAMKTGIYLHPNVRLPAYPVQWKRRGSYLHFHRF